MPGLARRSTAEEIRIIRSPGEKVARAQYLNGFECDTFQTLKLSRIREILGFDPRNTKQSGREIEVPDSLEVLKLHQSGQRGFV
jgi:hypothetical protein